MSAPWPLDEQLCFAVYAANMAIQRSYKPMLDRLGLTYPQYLALHVLWEEDGRTIGAIAIGSSGMYCCTWLVPQGRR